MDEKKIRETIISWERQVASYTKSSYFTESMPYIVSNFNAQQRGQLDCVASSIVSKARDNETLITNNLLGLQEEGVSYFVELNSRFKSLNRIKEKIMQKSKVDNISVLSAGTKIYDALRYTIIIGDEMYTEMVDKYLHQIENMGYRVIKFRNNWSNEYYKGINVCFENEHKFRFEVQFHTPNDYAIKEGKLRDVYLIIRDPNSPKELVAKANAIRKYYQLQVIPPKGSTDYEYQETIKRRK